jgi:uncharacterized protein
MDRTTLDQLNEQLLQAVKDDDIEAIKKAIEEGADVNTKNEYGNPLLSVAVWNVNTKLVKLLLENKVNVNATDEDGDRPLHYAAEFKNPEIANLLKQHGGV